MKLTFFWFIFMTFDILLYLTIFHQKVGNLSFYSFAIKAGIGDLVFRGKILSFFFLIVALLLENLKRSVQVQLSGS